MKITDVKTALKLAFQTGRPVFLHGAPGVGKSDAVKQAALETARNLIDVRAILLDPVDMRGLPTVNGDGRAAWAMPDFMPRADRDGAKGVLFLDELNAAPQSVQAACYQLVLDRKLGDYRLPDGWTVIAAGNRETDRAVVNKMPSALANRFIHLSVDVDLDDWVKWAITNDLPTELIAFMRFRPELLHSFDPQSKEKAFASPRTWAFAADLLQAKPDPAIEADMYSGTVGEGPAAELMGFLRIFRSLPDPTAVLMHPDTAPVPDDPATLYALCGALARKADRDNFGRATQYIGRLPAEFGVLLVRDAIQHNPDVQNTRAFIEWASANEHVML